MTLISIGIRKVPESNDEYHYTAYFSPYNITIDADTKTDAIRTIKDCIIKESVKRKNFDIEELQDTTPDTTEIITEIDIEKAFRLTHSNIVRRNISLPEWLDIKLRDLDTDASKLFQDAAKEYIAQHENKISSVNDLVKYVSKEVLDSYVLSRIGH